MKIRTKRRIRNGVRGAISILLVIILMPMLTMSAIVVDSSRINLAKSMVSSAGDLAINTSLANYDTILKDVYGLFAMSQQENDADYTAKIQKYFEDTLVGYGVVSEDESGEYVKAITDAFEGYVSGTSDLEDSVRNFMQMSVGSFSATKLTNSSLANSEIMRAQLVEYMKYRAPLSVGLSFLDSLKAFTTIESQNTVVKKQVAAQEKAQDVTSACSTAMQSIRDYDDLIESIQNGEKAVKGVSNPDDGSIVKLENYNTQVDKYKSTWGNSYNYSYINKITLEFFTNNPSTDGIYLKKLGTTTFIDSSNNWKINSNSGISVTANLAGDKDSAKSQFDSQNTIVDGLAPVITNYVNQNFVPVDGTAISSDSKTFVNDQKVYNEFIKYEKFLTDKSSSGVTNYSEIKSMLEQLVLYGKYYDNCRSLFVADENAKKTERTNAYNEKVTANNNYQTAQNNVNNINSTTSTYSGYVNSNINYINDQTKSFREDSTTYSCLKGIKNSNNKSLKSRFSSIIAQISSPTATKSVSGKTFNDYSSFKSKFKYSSSDKLYKYLTLFDEIVNSSLADKDEYKDLCKDAKKYVEKKKNGYSVSFSSYVTHGKDTDLYKILEMLNNCNSKTVTMIANISKYDSAVNGYSSAKDNLGSTKTASDQADRDYTAADTAYKEASAARVNLENQYYAMMKKFKSGVDRYQKDMRSYASYVSTAKNVAATKATGVKNQFTAIETNLKSILTALETISTNLTSAKTFIETYNTYVGYWETENNTYSKENGSDSFSNSNSDEIKSSKTEYNLDSLISLIAYVDSIHTEFSDLYDYIENQSYYKYGSTRIGTIDTASKLSSAVSSVKQSLPVIVTESDANGKLNTLYPGWSAPSIMQDLQFQVKFLEPNIIPLQFLMYLNTTYPEQATSTETTYQVTDENGKTEEKSNGTKEEYDSLKSSLSSEKKTEDTGSSGFGYTYSEKTIPDGMPSAGSDTTTVDNKQFKLTESDGKIDASTSMDSQSSVLDSILSGIGNVAETGLENLYILSYIFENFSYNTMVQDTIVEVEGLKDYMTDKGKVTLDKYTGATYVSKRATMLSNYNIDAKNNFLYGAEAEYILYGNKTASTNVLAAKASIYAIRFAFDCIYAFTNSEIKTITMSAGLAVQAATCGIVPYKIVQVVLQLAFAAAEAALDLDAMNSGFKIAVVKTSDTWMLSLGSVAGSVIKNAASKAIDYGAKKLTTTIKGGVQKVVDASVDELSGAITDLAEDMSNSISAKSEEILNSVFAKAESEVENALNKIQFIDYSQKNCREQIVNCFTEAKKIDLASLAGDNELATKIIENSGVKTAVNNYIEKIENEVLSTFDANTTNTDQIGKAISEKMTSWKMDALNSVNTFINNAKNSVKSTVDSYATQAKEKINSYASEKIDEMSEEATEALKEKVSSATDSFVNNFIADGKASSTMGKGMDAGTSSGGSSLASLITFGYKDYLMLFTYLGICLGGKENNAIIKRVADVIELNLTKTGSDAQFQHKLKAAADSSGDDSDSNATANTFKMSKAYTYVAIDATVELDMLFLNMDFFTRMIESGDEEGDGEIEVENSIAGSKITYHGMLGY